MKLSVSSYSFSQYISKGKLTQLDCVKKASEMGFGGIEFTTLEPYKNATLEDQLLYADKIKNEAEKYGIEIVAYTIGANLYQPTEEENDTEVERVKLQLDVAAARAHMQHHLVPGGLVDFIHFSTKQSYAKFLRHGGHGNGIQRHGFTPPS